MPDVSSKYKRVCESWLDACAIEQDADVVLFIYRDDYYRNEESEEPGVAEFLVQKNRHGEVGTIKLHWDGEHTKFSEIDRIHG